MTRTHFAVVVTMLASVTWAFHEDRPPGAEFHLEQNSETVAAQQAYQGRMDAVGGVPARESSGEAEIRNTREVGAAANLNQATRRQLSKDNLKAAENRRKEPPKPPSRPWWFAGILVVLGVGGYFGARNWIGQNIPAAPVLKRKKRSQIKR